MQDFIILLASLSLSVSICCVSNLQGSMKNVMDCLSTLRAQFAYMGVVSPTGGIKYGSPRGDASSNGLSSSTFGEEKRKFSPESKIQQALRSPVMTGMAYSLP
jgi:kinesin family protein C2/C3